MNPSIGRIVHLKGKDGITIPMIVTEVHSETMVSGVAFQTHDVGIPSDLAKRSIEMGDAVGQWSWPPRV